MKRKTLLINCFLLLTFLGNILMAENLPPLGRGSSYVPGTILIKFKPGIRPESILTDTFGFAKSNILSVDRLNQKYQVKKMYPLFPGEKPPSPDSKLKDLSGFYVLEFPETVELEKIIGEYRQDFTIESAEPDVICRIFKAPNDPEYQWHLNRIDAFEAWDIETGDSTIILAIIDTGVLYTHPDLSAAIWHNPDEIPGNGEDDDGNYKVDDVVGWDFVTGGCTDCHPNEDCSVADNDPNDFDGHGTHCAGIAAAVTNNSQGVSGIAGGWWTEKGCKIMALRIGWATTTGLGYVKMSWAAQAINYARNKGASVINCSWGSHYEPALKEALDNAIAEGIVVCAAVGNDNVENPIGQYLIYRSDVITVAATDMLDQKADFSNYGSCVDISAPGVSIKSTYAINYSPTYALLGGTSMSCPMVVGVAGLLKSKKPSLSREEVTTMILDYADTIDHLNPGYEGKLGSGRVNPNNFLVVMPTARFYADSTFGKPPLNVQFHDSSCGDGLYAWKWDFGDDSSSTELNPLHTYQNPGVYSPSLTVWGTLDSETTVMESYIGVYSDTVIVAQNEGYPAEEEIYLPIYVRNYVPVSALVITLKFGDGTAPVTCDSVNFSGTRVEYFSIKNSSISPYNQTIYLFLMGDPPLEPGYGVVCNAYFTLDHYIPVGDSVVVDSSFVGGSSLTFNTSWGSFLPDYVKGKIYVADPPIGDADRDGSIDLADVIMIADYILKGGPASNPRYLMDVNGDKEVDLLDAIYLANFILKGGPPPVPWES